MRLAFRVWGLVVRVEEGGIGQRVREGERETQRKKKKKKGKKEGKSERVSE